MHATSSLRALIASCDQNFFVMKFRISTSWLHKSCLHIQRPLSSLPSNLNKKISIKKLLSLPIPTILEQIAVRCKEQYDHLEIYPETRPVRILRSLYKDTVENIKVFQGNHPPEKKQALDRLLKAQLESLDTRHGMVTETLADAFLSLSHIDYDGSDARTPRHLQKMEHFLPSILRRQAGISVLLQHGVGLTSSQHYSVMGCVADSNIMALCTGVKNQADTLANHQFNWSPDIIISVKNDSSSSVNITCIPSFARFVLLEIFKNSLQATAELYLSRNPNFSEATSSPDFDISGEEIDIPIVKVDLECSDECVRIIVKDEGSGMTAEQLDRASMFLGASTIKVSSMVEAQMSYQPMSEPLRGLGVGLCLSSVYATHFGGTLEIHSNGKNQGTTVTFTIPRDIDILEKD